MGRAFLELDRLGLAIGCHFLQLIQLHTLNTFPIAHSNTTKIYPEPLFLIQISPPRPFFIGNFSNPWAPKSVPNALPVQGRDRLERRELAGV